MNEGLVRIGTVTDVNFPERMVRVHFRDVGIVSGWLKVIKSPPFIPEKSQIQETDSTERHTHKVTISPWFPNIGENVLCLYNYGFNADGYVLGAI